MKPLPFVISIPHGGREIPEELRALVIASPDDQREDIDHLTREIFAQPEGFVAHQLVFDVARTFVDLNRVPQHWGERFPDGVVKTLTHLDRPVFSQFPEDELVQQVLDLHFYPYHQALAEAVADPEVVLLLDCHSMAPHGLSVSPDRPGQPRPLINLGHRGGATAPLWLVEMLREIMVEVYELPQDQVLIDHPFDGGYITANHGSRGTSAIQIEFNRAFYLGDQEGQATPSLEPDTLNLWQTRFARVLTLLQERAFASGMEFLNGGTGLQRPTAKM